jgi:hypothetical protein
MIASDSEFRALTAEPDILRTRQFRWNSISRKTRIGYRDTRGKASTRLWTYKSFILYYLELAQGPKAFQFLGHELELAFLLQAIVQGLLEGLKSEIPLGLEEFIG